MELWKRCRAHVRACCSPRRVSSAVPWAAGLIAWLAGPLTALAQDNVVATATLPRDLSPWGMYLNADPVVKAVMIILVIASVVTWTVRLAESVRIFYAREGVRRAS